MTEREQEQKRCDEVIHRIQAQLGTLELNVQEMAQKADQAVKETANLTIKDGNEEALRESSFDQRQHEATLLIYEQQLGRVHHQIQVLNQMKKNPYFARIDVKLDGEERHEPVYIGIGAFVDDDNNWVSDWRAPIANLFYEGGTGHHSFEVDGTTIDADVNLKRQFIIENGQITLMEDTDDALMDKVLLKVLSDHSSGQMRNIVSTIQKEQNTIIRDTSHPYLLIEGVAGSGKTSALMQRIAYLLYTTRDHVSESAFLMLSPNSVYNEYVANVLPSLGEEDIRRYEWPDLVQVLVDETLIPIKNIQVAQWMQSMEAVLLFKTYLQRLDERRLQFKPIYLDKHTILVTPQQLRKLFAQTNPELPVGRRLQLIRQHLQKQIRRMMHRYQHSSDIEEQIVTEGDALYSQLITKNPEITEQDAEEMLREKLAERHFNAAIVQINQMKWINYKKQYLDFLHHLTEQTYIAADYAKQVLADWRNQQLTLEDAKYYLALYHALSSREPVMNYEYIFIDEVQDYTPLDLFTLTQLFPNAKYTLCGDGNQMIFNRPNALKEMEMIFDHTMYRIPLLTSYRNTEAITQFASAILGQDVAIESVQREGAKPIVDTRGYNEDVICEYVEQRNGRLAFITVDDRNAEAFYRRYHKRIDMHLVDDRHGMGEAEILVVPLRLAKGLEFDEVVMLNTVNLPKGNIIYTMVTRAMHRLVVLDQQVPNWLENVDEHLYTRR